MTVVEAEQARWRNLRLQREGGLKKTLRKVKNCVRLRRNMASQMMRKHLLTQRALGDVPAWLRGMNMLVHLCCNLPFIVILYQLCVVYITTLEIRWKLE